MGTDHPADHLRGLFNAWKGQPPDHISELPGSGSARKYYRLSSPQGETWIGAFNDDIQENETFFYLSKHFESKGLRVPSVLRVSDDRRYYILTDLGDQTLYALLQKQKDQGGDEEAMEPHYLAVLADLIRFQLEGPEGLDPERLYPVPSFSKQAVHWDLNYFKYYFLRLAGVPYNESSLQKSLDKLADAILRQSAGYFMYRDFQSRNILLHDNTYYYIDYQGGRFGPLTYDPASLLFNTRAALSPAFREKLLGHYIQMLSDRMAIDADRFRQEYYLMALLRVLQAMGAYGYRGYFERKPLFLSGIPFGQDNLAWLLRHGGLTIEPYLRDLLEDVAGSDALRSLAEPTLSVSLQSFSYLHGIPSDLSGHGGGFVFDCRALPNPGREVQYSLLTGRDEAVVRYLEAKDEVSRFLHHTTALIQAAIETYRQRRFTHLSVSFGCTGGRHRSVYCAEQMASVLREMGGVRVRLRHLEIDGISA